MTAGCALCYGHSALVGEHDRYLSAREEPRYRFAVIGAGNMGQEHIRVTLLEGRATIAGIYDPEPLSVANAQAAFAMFGGGLMRCNSA